MPNHTFAFRRRTERAANRTLPARNVLTDRDRQNGPRASSAALGVWMRRRDDPNP